MNIYLIRHGDAEKASISKKDFDRELTQSGKIKMKVAAESWKNLVDEFDYIITSPLVRTIQTAQIIAEIFGIENKIIPDRKLSPGCTTNSIIEVTNSLSGEDFAFVGHQPDLSDILSDLISNKGTFVDFKKGAIAKISFHNRVHQAKGTLEFLIPANVFTKTNP